MDSPYTNAPPASTDLPRFKIGSRVEAAGISSDGLIPSSKPFGATSSTDDALLVLLTVSVVLGILQFSNCMVAILVCTTISIVALAGTWNERDRNHKFARLNRKNPYDHELEPPEICWGLAECDEENFDEGMYSGPLIQRIEEPNDYHSIYAGKKTEEEQLISWPEGDVVSIVRELLDLLGPFQSTIKGRSPNLTKYLCGITRRKSVLKMPPKLFASFALVMFVPLSVAAIANSSASSLTATITAMNLVTTANRTATVTSMPHQPQNHDAEAGNTIRDLLHDQWLKITLLLFNLVWAGLVLGVSYWIYSGYCDSTSRKFDKKRMFCLGWMVVFQLAYSHTKDDPNSLPGVLLGLFLASGLFTYKSAHKSTNRFRFGLIYSVAGTLLGLAILCMVLAWSKTSSREPSWDELVSPCIALAFLLLEITSQCVIALMRYQEEDEVEPEGNEVLPYYRNGDGIMQPGWINLSCTGSFWQNFRSQPANSHGLQDMTRLSQNQRSYEPLDNFLQTQGISHSVDLPHPDSLITLDNSTLGGYGTGTLNNPWDDGVSASRVRTS